ncbi:MAG: alpha-glucan family phosphorylase [Bacteroidota bacterium]
MQDRDARRKVAYFCMEYALHEELPIYAGGLGVLAGDYLKSAADLGLPVVGIGILWQKGTRQAIGEDGWPRDFSTDVSSPKIRDTGVRVSVSIRGREVKCRVSMVEGYGNAPLYLLDVDLPENEERRITDRLYCGSSEDRIAQEIVLGIGGIRALRALGLAVDLYHFNEGHAVLAGLELIREKMALGMGFEEAWRATREQVVFTTHTPVPAGNETHDLGLLEYMGGNNSLPREQMARIGGDPFNMTLAGLRLARSANAVSALHARTAREMWSGANGAAPIIPITNGVHPGTWQDPAVAEAFARGAALTEPHRAAKERLLRLVAERTGRDFHGGLLIGFARRAAAYKRGDLILARPEVIESPLSTGRLRLLYAGKAHPDDHHGKEIVARLVGLARRFPHAVAFLEDYDLMLGRTLTQGCDVWLNNPRPPQEASGTSGMKAAMNGVLNLSILDGWWPEGCRHGENGWRFAGSGDDLRDADELYRVLLDEVVPAYADEGRWDRMMRASVRMAQEFSSHRMIAEYYNKLYMPENEERATA